VVVDICRGLIVGILLIIADESGTGDDWIFILQVGVNPESVKIISGTIEKVFTEKRDGLAWTTVTIGGTTDKVTEDLSSRFISAAASGLVDRLPGGIKEILTGEDGELPEGGIRDILKDKAGDFLKDKATESETIDKAKKIIDVLGPIFGR